MNDKSARKAKKSGRPLSFDPEWALDELMRVFWRQGYQATSVEDLARSIGVTKPSVYGSFGDKQQIFLKSLDHYVDTAPQGEERFQNDTGPLKANLLRLLERVVSDGGEAKREPGCMLVNATVECMQLGSPFSDHIHAGHDLTIGRLRRILERARERGELSDTADLDRLAHYLNMLTVGAAVMKKAGADRREITAALEIGLEALDSYMP
ncbi:TetR/AcrR family transcriptional regulator [Microbulbifer hainanensis]|uniref:TetR/AcrR family transcriptional regulator n=1 Tax=Microbulbifer hainanensis TaxID=2735675 RepID=UPI001865FB8F|nr:TetR/AcrR family transcriptional regulator [Microbulbifer hainanensis]